MDREQALWAEEIEQQMKTLEGRDLQLWSISLLIVLVVTAGLVSVLLPNVMWKLGTLHLDGRYVPQLFFGFIVLIILFNIYLLEQRRGLHNLREALWRETFQREAAEKLSLVDPVTEIFNRRYLDQIVSREVTSADRRRTPLGFLMIDVQGLKSVNSRFGHRVGDRVLKEVGRLLRRTYRPSDTVIRYGGDEFLVVMPDTSEPQAQRAFERLLGQVDFWNRENAAAGFQLTLNCGLASYTTGARIEEVLEAAIHRMDVHKASQSRAS